MLSRALARGLSPAGSRARLSVLIFHRVLPAPDPLFPEEPDAGRFDQILAWLGNSFNVLPLDQAARRLSEGTLPSRAVAITFDDGYEDNCSVALPILRRHGVSATFFIASGFLDGGRMWNDTVVESVRATRGPVLNLDALGLGRYPVETWSDKRAVIDTLLPMLKYLPLRERVERAEAIAGAAGLTELPGNLMMSSEQVRSLRVAGMQVGAHTRDHPILSRLDDREARDQICGSKADLEAILGESVGLFAYPNGKPKRDYTDVHVVMLREAGFETAVSTSTGASQRGSDRLQLPRFTPWDRSEQRFALRLARNMLREGVVA